MAEWEDIKRLAADFQKVQSTSTTQKLSERNCIEIVTWLTSHNVIDLIFSIDGKEYLTVEQLMQDIQMELFANGGRLNLGDLAKRLAVDVNHVNGCVPDILRNNKEMYLVLGQLINETYIIKIANEINQRLLQQGQINIAELTVQYDLPAEFLQHQVVDRNLGKLIEGKQDKNDSKTYFTEAFISRCIARVRGALYGLTKPITVAAILSQLEINENLFFTLFDDIHAYGTLTSRLSSSQYIPEIYTASQTKWVKTFYQQNGYLEYDGLTRLGISDCRAFIKHQLTGETIHYLPSAAVSQRLVERLEADIDECIQSGSYVHIPSNVPSVFSSKDTEMLVRLVTDSQAKYQRQTVCLDEYILSQSFINQLITKYCTALIQREAENFVNSGKYQSLVIQQQKKPPTNQSTKSQRQTADVLPSKDDKKQRKTGSGKSGGGLQGRETKVRVTNRKYLQFKNQSKQSNDKDEELSGGEEDETGEHSHKQITIISVQQIAKEINSELANEGITDLNDALSKYLWTNLNPQALEKCASLYTLKKAQEECEKASQGGTGNESGSAPNRRQNHSELQTKLNALLTDIRLFDKGLKQFASDMQLPFVKYLFKTLCTDFTNEIINYLAQEQKFKVNAQDLNTEQKIRIIQSEFERDMQTPLVKLLKSQSIDEFMGNIEHAFALCNMIIKKVDKKRDKQLVYAHRLGLQEQLGKCEDEALVLHLAVLVMFTVTTNCMLHASGRHVTSILTFLKPFLTTDEAGELTAYHDFVTLMLSGGSEVENAREKLREKMFTVRDIAMDYKKPGQKSAT